MRKKIVVGCILGFGLFAATAAQAASLSSTQVSAVLSVLQSFGADQSVINNVSAALGGSATTNASCVNLSNNLTLGASGSDVTSHQDYLIAHGDLAARYNTGYYGFLTAQAIRKLQLSLGILSPASDSAYGIVGPQTRRVIACGGTISQPTTVRFAANEMPGSD
jgi:peptidoglycan hydrolase-like protein with peptidoglycan-binding domain